MSGYTVIVIIGFMKTSIENDVTDLMSVILWQSSKDGEDPGQSTARDLISAHQGLLTPGEPYEPDEDDEEIISSYNEYLGDLFGKRSIY